jgi:hypothetical protein
VGRPQKGARSGHARCYGAASVKVGSKQLFGTRAAFEIARDPRRGSCDCSKNRLLKRSCRHISSRGIPRSRDGCLPGQGPTV